MPEHGQFLTVQAAAAVLRLHPSALRRAMRHGLLVACQRKDQSDAC